MLVIGIILIVVGLAGAIWLSLGFNDDHAVVYWLLGICFIFGIALVSINKKEYHSDYSLKEYSVKIEVHQEIINGQVINRDTVYIFTSKK